MKGNTYKTIKPYCPECVVELLEEERKFGKTKKWLVCPTCGMRIAKSGYSDNLDPELSSKIYQLNQNGGMRINN